MSTNSGGLLPAVSNYHDIYVQQQPRNDEVESITTVLPTAPSLTELLPPQATTPLTSGESSRTATGIYPHYAPATAQGSRPEPSTSRRGEPPSYEEAVDIDTPPPSYDSLFGRVREAHKSSKGVLEFITNVVVLILGTLGCTIILGITIVVPVCMIVLGTLYLYSCPQGEYIPVYLLVGGAFGVLKQLLHLSTRVRSREEQELERLRQTPTQTLLNCFMLGWFIIGSFWVYQIYEPNYDPSLGKYCNKTLYLFTFWLITSVYMTLAVVTVVLCSVSLMSVLLLPQS